MPLIVDISNNNPEPLWGALKSHGVTGVYLKATEGATFRDKTSAARARRARAAGMRVGFYHFARPQGGDAMQEAFNFTQWIKDAGGIQRRDLRPVLDLEETEMGYGGLGSWSRLFNAQVKSALGVGPLFYSYPFFIQRMRLEVPIGYGLWLASYGRNDGKRYSYAVPKPWKRAVLHQYTSEGKLGAFEGDISYYEPGKIRALLAHPVLGIV